MVFIDESQAKGISKRVIRELFDTFDPDKNKAPSLDISNLGPKKRARTIKRLCQTHSGRLVFLEERYKEKTRWEIVFGEWSVGYSGRGMPKSKNEYDRLLFDLVLSQKSSLHEKFFYVVITKHALIRMIMRSGKNLTTLESVFMFLSSLTRDTILAGMSMVEGNSGDILESNGFYLPLILEEGLNLYGKRATSIVVKTVLPERYVIDHSAILECGKFRDTIFELPECFSAGGERPLT